VYLYGSEAITFLNAFLSSDCPHYRQPSPLSVWQHNLRPFGREL
jgi:hypothetical protein